MRILISLLLFFLLSGQIIGQKGWTMLFDGSNLSQWHTYKNKDASGWMIENGAVTSDGKSGDLVTNKDFTNFILEFDFKIQPKGNSGVIYKVLETDDKAFFSTYASGPEYQIIDDTGYPDKLNETQKTGSNYDIYPPSSIASKPAGEWNHGLIKVSGKKVTHVVNGVNVVHYEYGTPAWQTAVAKSKFATWPYAHSHAAGKIALQGHNDPVYFKNIKIKELR